MAAVGTDVLRLQLNIIGVVVAALGTVLDVKIVQFPAHHQAHQLVFRQLGSGAGIDVFSIPQHRDIIGNAVDFVHLVGDVHDGFVLLLQLFNDFEEFFHLPVGNGGGGLVHDDDVGVVAGGLHNLHHLHLCNAQIPDLFRDVHLHAQLVKKLLGLFAQVPFFHDGQRTRQFPGP